VLLELAMFWAKFGDPLFAIKAVLSGINRHYVQALAIRWGSDSPWFYFRQMFLDGRDMWLVPYFALAGLLLLARERFRGNAMHPGSHFIMFWALALVCIFSFFVYSLDPLKLMPKQENYALMFFAPIALLGGYALSRTKGFLLAVFLLMFATGASLLTAISGYNNQLHYSALQKAVSFSGENPEALVFVSRQAIHTAYLANLAAGIGRPPENLLPLDSWPVLQASGNPGKRPQFAIVDPFTPEFASPDREREMTKVLSRCWRHFATLRPEAGGIGGLALRFLSWLRPVLPLLIDRQLSFVYRLTTQREVRIYHYAPDTGC